MAGRAAGGGRRNSVGSASRTTPVDEAPRLATIVVGAGPAGLLFVVVGRILAEKAGVQGAWAIRLVDKREVYARTHRLRIDPAPYRAIRRDLSDPRFDALVAMLDAHDFQPEVNLLEDALASVARELGVTKEKRAIRTLADLEAMRADFDGESAITIVGADSVHSTIRELVGADRDRTHVTHERLARLRVRGGPLPKQLGLVDRVRISKVLGSIVDYRLNRNGHAEVDLFLTEREHDAVREVGATPKAPVPIASRDLSRLGAPLFRAIVAHLESGLGAKHDVEVQSTFELEHTVTERVVHDESELGATVFLLGDAAVSLPFFRGMASLARSAHALAHVHVDLAMPPAKTDDADAFRARHPIPLVSLRPLPGEIVEVRATVHRGAEARVILHRWVGRWGVHVVREHEGKLQSLRSIAPVSEAIARAELDAQVNVARRYQLEVNEIVAHELGVVRARARLVRAAREAFRVAAMLPFPIQTWLLRAPERDATRDRATPGLAINASLAGAALALVIASSRLESIPLAIAASFVQLAGGAAYRGALALEAPPHRWVVRTWTFQIAALFVLGIATSVPRLAHGISITALAPLSWWLVLAIPFVIGMLAVERILSREIARAGLDA